MKIPPPIIGGDVTSRSEGWPSPVSPGLQKLVLARVTYRDPYGDYRGPGTLSFIFQGREKDEYDIPHTASCVVENRRSPTWGNRDPVDPGEPHSPSLLDGVLEVLRRGTEEWSQGMPPLDWCAYEELIGINVRADIYSQRHTTGSQTLIDKAIVKHGSLVLLAEDGRRAMLYARPDLLLTGS